MNNILFIFANRKDEKDFIPELQKLNHITFSHVLNSRNKDNFNLSLADCLMYDLYSIYNSKKFYSHYHNIIERKPKNKIRLTIRYILWNIYKKFPSFFISLYEKYLDFNLSYLPSVFYKFNKFYLRKYISIISNNKAIIFCSTVSSTEEFNFLRASIIQNKVNGVCTRNWDNPSSKTFIYPKYFSFIMSWSEQMDNHYRILFENFDFKLFRYLTPRFNYIKKYKKENYSINQNSILVLYAGSQKMITHELKLLNYISKKIYHINKNINFIYRPHPWNCLQSSNLEDLTKNNINLFLDPSIISFLKNSRDITSLPIFDDNVANSLTEIIYKSNIIISPAGTLSLEAGLLSKPVIVDLTNSKQSTLKLHIYMDHFNSYAMEDWVYPCFSFDQIIKSIINIIKNNKNNNEYRKCEKYADINNAIELSEILDSVINS